MEGIGFAEVQMNQSDESVGINLACRERCIKKEAIPMKRCALSHWLPPPSAALMLLLFAPLATADLASAVAGLSPGAQYRVVFITQSTRDAVLYNDR